MSVIKHLGTYKGSKSIVVFNSIPGDEDFALIVQPDNLPGYVQDEVIAVLNSVEGQTAQNLGEVLDRRTLSDGENVLSSLHLNKFLVKVEAKDVTLTPNAKDEINLAELNKELGNIAAKKEAQKPQLANANTDGVSVDTMPSVDAKMANAPQQDVDDKEEQLAIARNLLQQAELIQADAEKMKQNMIDDAKAKVQKAYEIAPELKPKKGKGRPSKDSSIFEG